MPRGEGPGTGRGMGGAGRGGREGPLRAGPGGTCVCPNCGQREPHQIGVPCFDRRCPKCGTAMARE